MKFFSGHSAPVPAGTRIFVAANQFVAGRDDNPFELSAIVWAAN